jgi:hypothetical protein
MFVSAGTKLERRDRLHVSAFQEAVVAPDEVHDEDFGQALIHLHVGKRTSRGGRGHLSAFSTFVK